MYKKLLLYAVALSTCFIANAFTLKHGDLYFDNTKAQFDNVSMICQGIGSQIEIVSMTLDPETGLYKASLKPSFEEYTAIGFINKEMHDTIIAKRLHAYVKELSSLNEPPVEPTDKTFYIGEISIKLPFENDNVFLPYMSETADIAGNWVPLHPENFTASGKLPILYLNTKDGENLECKAKNINATFYFDAMGNEGCESIGSAEEPLSTKIKGRGNATWRNIAKKPYKLKLDKAASFFGMPANKHWALMAHTMGPMDWLVNASAFNLANSLDFGWHPHLYPIELVLNGDYQGVYFLCETIKISEGRLEIFEQKDKETDPEVIPGGWLVEIDNYDEDIQIRVPEDDMILRVTPHTPEELSQEQFDWLTDEFTSLVSEIYNPDKDNTTWMEHIDPYDMAKYFIIQEIYDNPDGFNGSFYLHKDQGQGQKWHAGPLWDVSCYTRDKTDWTFLMDAGYGFQSHWIKELIKYPEFRSIVKEVLLTIEDQLADLYQFNLDYAKNVARGMDSNHLRWPTFNKEEPRVLAERLNYYLQKNVLYFRDKIDNVQSTTAIKEIICQDGVRLNVEGNCISIITDGKASMDAYDVTGRKIASSDSNEITLPNKGITIIQVTTDSTSFTQKVLVK